LITKTPIVLYDLHFIQYYSLDFLFICAIHRSKTLSYAIFVTIVDPMNCI